MVAVRAQAQAPVKAVSRGDAVALRASLDGSLSLRCFLIMRSMAPSAPRARNGTTLVPTKKSLTLNLIRVF